MENVLSNIQAVLSTTAARWQSLIETIPGALLTRQPAPKEWSALECLQHVLDCERLVFPVRLQAFLAGQNFPDFDPDTVQRNLTAETTPAETAAKFTNLRTISLKMLAKETDADLSRTAIHDKLGQVTLAEMLNEWGGHDLMHIVQAERAIMQPFISGCGPWRFYFLDHDAVVHKPD